MAQDTQSEGTGLFQFDAAADSKPARASIGLRLLQGVVAIGVFAVAVAMFSAGVVWIVNRAHQEQASAGGGRVEEEYYDWTQERPKEAGGSRR